MKNYFILAISVLFSACITDTIPELQQNVLDHSDDLFILEDVEFIFYSNTQRHVDVTFSNPYEQLNDIQKSKLAGIEVVAPGYNKQIEPTRTSFFEFQRDIGETRCYELRFLTVGGGASETSEICVEVMP